MPGKSNDRAPKHQGERMVSSSGRLTNNSSEILDRQNRVTELRTQGRTVAEIATQMGCSRHVVTSLLSRASDARLNAENIGWMQGLPHRVMRTLIQHGYVNKAQVSAALENRELTADQPDVGAKMLASLSAWLGVPLPARSDAKVATAEAIARARRVLERAGYTVVPPGDANL